MKAGNWDRECLLLLLGAFWPGGDADVCLEVDALVTRGDGRLDILGSLSMSESRARSK